MLSGPTLYAWVNPLALDPKLDHTWVTSYPIPPVHAAPGEVPTGQLFWYCWGDYHPQGMGGVDPARPGFIGAAAANLDLARCICAPQQPSAHGTIFHYGIDGVCHQLANQILYATGAGAAPLTVRAARGFRLSSALFGVYGRTEKQFKALVRNCGGTPLLGAREDDMADDLERLIEEALGGRLEPERHAALLRARDEFHAAGEALRPELAAANRTPEDLAAEANARINQFLAKAAATLSPEEFRTLFGVEPGESAHLVDPAMMRRSLGQ